MTSYDEAVLKQKLEPALDRMFASFCERRFSEWRRRQLGRPQSIFVLNRVRRDIARELRPVFDAEVERSISAAARRIEARDQ